MKISEIIEELDYRKIINDLSNAGGNISPKYYDMAIDSYRTKQSVQEQLLDFPIQSVCVRVATEMIMNNTAFKGKIKEALGEWCTRNGRMQIAKVECEIEDLEERLEYLREDLAALKGECAEPHSGGKI